ncbi:hypothetical protein [Alloactinosynnema sp. L-07]|nr:hypothetical protein [Alloactinosynnema sp. L-07]CRK59961.1 hypothetical protein [Alloactinosynnema sp. L-07]
MTEADAFDDLEDAYWSRRAADVLAKAEPPIPWDEAVALLDSGQQTD